MDIAPIKEIDFWGMAKKVIAHKRLLYGTFVASTVIGIIVAFNIQKKYTSEVIVAPGISSSMGMADGLSDLASMVGVDLKSDGSSVDAIYPQIYPDIFASNDFVLDLFDIQVQLLDSTGSKTYYQHILKDTHIPFWSYPKLWLVKLIASFKKPQKGVDGVNPFRLSKIQTEVCEVIKSNIKCFLATETNVITLSVTDTDPQVAALMADTIQRKLQNYIMAYRTQKARNDYEFAVKVYKEAQFDYEEARRKYGAYADANTDLEIPSYRLTLEDLENDMQIKYNAFSSAVQQMNTAKMKIQERTPAFTIIQNATIPLKSSSIPRIYILIAFVFLGVLFDAVWVLGWQEHHWGRFFRLGSK